MNVKISAEKIVAISVMIIVSFLLITGTTWMFIGFLASLVINVLLTSIKLLIIVLLGLVAICFIGIALCLIGMLVLPFLQAGSEIIADRRSRIKVPKLRRSNAIDD